MPFLDKLVYVESDSLLSGMLVVFPTSEIWGDIISWSNGVRVHHHRLFISRRIEGILSSFRLSVGKQLNEHKLWYFRTCPGERAGKRAEAVYCRQKDWCKNIKLRSWVKAEMFFVWSVDWKCLHWCGQQRAMSCGKFVTIKKERNGNL